MPSLHPSFLRQIFSLLTVRQKVFFVLLSLLFLLSALLNVLSYTIMGPLIALASGANTSIRPQIESWVRPFLGSSHLLMKFTLLVLAFQIFRIVLRLANSYVSVLFVRDIMRRLFKRVLTCNMDLSYVDYQKKDFHLVSRDLSFVTRYGNLLISVLEIFANLIIMISYIALLFYLSWQITSCIFVYFTAVFILFELVIKRLIRLYGQEANEFDVRQVRAVTLLFRNFKFIKTRGDSIQTLQDQYVSSGVSSFYRRALLGIFQFLNSSLIEFSGIVVLVGLCLYFNYICGGIAGQLGILSIYAISFYRMIPVLNELMLRYQVIVEQHDTVQVLLESLSQVQERINYLGPAVSFKEKIVFEKVSYAYEEYKPVLRDISFTINKGDRIGVVGESGTGKTTLGDLLIGLLQPCSGTITIDGVLLTDENLGRWRKSVGYIPQSIFLFDGTVAENVAFDLPVDERNLIKTLKQAQIWQFLQEKEGINTLLTLDGSCFSGGQRQRLGIARTFYMGAELIVLDEATSALDTQTEAQIMKEIYEHREGATLFIIAHRLSTLNRCNKIIHMEKGSIRMIETRDVLE